MPMIELANRPVYRAPTKGRCYLTIGSAAKAEASALLEKKYPSERAAYDDSGRCYDQGYHWSSDQRLLAVHARLTAIILRQFRKSQRRAHARDQGITQEKQG